MPDTVPQDSPARRAARKSVLLLDDETRVLTALRAVLAGGYELRSTTDAAEALRWVGEQHFDVIVSDQRMPTMTGTQFLGEARRLSPSSTRILLTGYSDQDAVVAAMNEAEIYRFVHKPWDNATLRRVIGEACEIAAASRAGRADPLAAADAAARGPATPERVKILVVDAAGALMPMVEPLATSATLTPVHSVAECLGLLAGGEHGVLVCALDIQSDEDRGFLKRLKQHHPDVLAITICNTADSVHLIELINEAKVYRFLREPVNPSLLKHYLGSALAQSAIVVPPAASASSSRAKPGMRAPATIEPRAAAAQPPGAPSLSQRLARLARGWWRRS